MKKVKRLSVRNTPLNWSTVNMVNIPEYFTVCETERTKRSGVRFSVRKDISYEMHHWKIYLFGEGLARLPSKCFYHNISLQKNSLAQRYLRQRYLWDREGFRDYIFRAYMHSALSTSALGHLYTWSLGIGFKKSQVICGKKNVPF